MAMYLLFRGSQTTIMLLGAKPVTESAARRPIFRRGMLTLHSKVLYLEALMKAALAADPRGI
jgi:hypothetical protein